MAIPGVHHETARLVLRMLEPSDRQECVRFQVVSREHLRMYSPLRPAGQSDDAFFDEQLAKARLAMERRDGLRLVAVVRPGVAGLEDHAGRHAGYFNLNNIVRGVFQSADGGWRVSAELIGRGIATEGAMALLDLAFAPEPRGLGLHRVQANIIPDNRPSRRVAEKCGFREEGLGRRMVMIGGVWRDHVMYAKLADEHTSS
jgi:ribosomal-protein-alanine N-acetyltransferase